MAEDPIDDVADTFDDWARADRDQGMAKRHRLTAGQVLDDLDLGPGEAFLDLGTGNGWAVETACSGGAVGVGIDVAEEMLERAYARGTPVAKADFAAMPFADGTFDVVFSMEAIYYADDLPAALEEIRRVLAPGGVHHAVMDFFEANEASADWPEMLGVDMHRLSDDGWARAFEDAGFVDVATERIRAEGAEDWRADVGSLHVSGRVPDPRT